MAGNGVDDSGLDLTSNTGSDGGIKTTERLEELRKVRSPARRLLMKLGEEVRAILSGPLPNLDELKKKMRELISVFDDLNVRDAEILREIASANLTESEEDAEYSGINKYRVMTEQLRDMVQQMQTKGVAEIPQGGESSGRKFKLPKIELTKFSGDLKDWLRFWAQFKKIDEDPELAASDKFCYLLQSLDQGTEAYELVAAYPQSEENYGEAVGALKRRYGNEDLLLQVYIREMLALVISNVTAEEKLPLRSLYIKVESHIRALATLNLAKADPASWLFPLVEAALPEDILANWQRSQESSSSTDFTGEPERNRLERLLKFMSKEVDIKQRNDLTASFTSNLKNATIDVKKQGYPLKQQERTKVSRRPVTHMGFHVADAKACVFCGLTNHKADGCRKAQNMSYEEKMGILKSKGRCFICTLPHRAADCRNKMRIKCETCQQPHLSILCKAAKKRVWVREDSGPPAKKSKTGERSDNALVNQVSNGDVCLPTLKLNIINKDRKETIRVFLDTGSSRSYILKRTAKKLELTPIAEEEVIHALFGGHKSKPVKHCVYDLTLVSLDKSKQLQVSIRDQERICARILKVDNLISKMKDELESKGIWLSDSGSEAKDEIELMIGADLFGRVITGKKIELSNNLTAFETIFGWSVIGEVDDYTNRTHSMAVTDSSVTQLWELETLGIRDSAEVMSKNEKENKIKEIFLSTVTRNSDGRYVVRLPWKEGHPVLPTNRNIAMKRLETTSNKLNKAGLLRNYNSLFVEWKAEGFIEDCGIGGASIHYLPHRAVVKTESLTTPVRPVFDASCKGTGSFSLNDCLHTGPSYILKIPDILLKFRERKVGFISDIRKAFQMIEVHEKDRDALRFLWWKNKDMKELKELRHVRVPFGATCSPFILGAVIEHHLKCNSTDRQEIANRLWESLYVDNCCSSENSIEEYKRFREESVDILAEAKMDLRMWLSNLKDLDDPETRCISVLGLKWDRKTDELYLDIKEIPRVEVVTKRVILSVVSKVFDPFGIASPALLPMKLLLQRSWVNKVKWDEELSGPEAREFREWCDSLNCLREIRVPRLISGDSPDHSTWELHIMSDGSKHAYGAVCFLRTYNGDQVNIQMLMSKSRVAPLTTLTIPRMELMGCLIGARMCKSIKEALKIKDAKEYYWTDSSTALAWILRNDQWGTFVGNRTKEIQELTCSRDWRHLPGVDNPADLPSRGCSPRALKDSEWWKGPAWLYQPKNNWPRLVEEFNEEEIGLERKKKPTPKEVMSNVVLDFGKQYSVSTLIRIQAWVRRYISNLRKEKLTGRLKKAEIERAEIDVILKIQDEAFASEEGLARLKTLETFKDEHGVIRVKTRLLNLEDDKLFRFPAVLPGDHSTVKQLIWDYHIGYCHGGVGFIMVKLREKYWILKSRQNIKKIVTRCYRCRKLSAKKTVTETAPLPLDRIRSAEVFEVVGIDLAGPFLLKNRKKVWLILYTCAVYRAVHIKVINSLTTAAFLRSLQQFVERYRRPVTIYSDNGTNFRGADNLFRALDWKAIQEDENVHRIEWKFNPPTASWWGGWWERLIRTIKDLIRKEIGNAVLNQEQLEVVVKRVEEVMNDRPLTYVSEDLNDLEPLTPAMFLNPLGITKFPEAERIDGEVLRSRLKYVRMVKRDLKIRFKKDYIALLVSRNSKKRTRPLRVGELVVVSYDNKKRSQWPLGRIIDLMPGADGVSRVAEVKTREGLLIRPVQRLHALEADNSDPICKMGEPKSRFGRSIRRPKRIDL